MTGLTSFQSAYCGRLVQPEKQLTPIETIVMSLIAKASGERISEPAPEGQHQARCVAIVDLGIQHSELYDKESHKVRFTWELPNCKKTFSEDKGPEPFIISRKFTLSLHRQSALLPFLERWRGRKFTKEEMEGFELKKVLGAPALLNVVHDVKEDGTIKAQVDLAMPCKDCPGQILPLVYYEVEMGRNEVYKALPQFLQDEIAKCQEWAKARPDPAAARREPSDGGVAEDDTPF